MRLIEAEGTLVKTICALICTALTACAIAPATSTSQSASTTCVSDPVAGGGDDDAVAQCPPPTSLTVEQALDDARTYNDQTNGVPTDEISDDCQFSGTGPGAYITSCHLRVTYGSDAVLIDITCHYDDHGDMVYCSTIES